MSILFLGVNIMEYKLDGTFESPRTSKAFMSGRESEYRDELFSNIDSQAIMGIGNLSMDKKYILILNTLRKFHSIQIEKSRRNAWDKRLCSFIDQRQYQKDDLLRISSMSKSFKNIVAESIIDSVDTFEAFDEEDMQLIENTLIVLLNDYRDFELDQEFNI